LVADIIFTSPIVLPDQFVTTIHDLIVKNGHGSGHVSSVTTSFERGLSKLNLSVVTEMVRSGVVIRDHPMTTPLMVMSSDDQNCEHT
jgi:hypothetical protein